MSYDSASLTTRDIKWLGVRPTDLDAYNIPKEVCVGGGGRGVGVLSFQQTTFPRGYWGVTDC